MVVKKDSGNKNIWLLGGSSFFNDVGSDMITPLLPFYVASLGGGGAALGLIGGLREGLLSILKLLGGWFSDVSGRRKPIVFLGYLFSIISRFFLIFAVSWRQVLTFVSLERFGKVGDAPRDVIITHSTKKRGRGFALHQALDTSGAILGTILVIFLFWWLELGMKSIIFVASLVASLSLIPLFFVRDYEKKPVKKGLIHGIKDLDKRLKYFIFVAGFFTLAHFGLYLFLILRAETVMGSIVRALVLYAVFNSFWAFFSVPFGKMSDVVGRKKVLLLGGVLFLVVIAGFMVAISFAHFLILFALYGLVYAIIQSNQRAFVSDLAGEMKGTALGLYGGIVGIVSIAAGLIAGLLWDKNPLVMFYYLFAVGIISLILLYFVKEGREFKN
jgi:MFS family permease